MARGEEGKGPTRRESGASLRAQLLLNAVNVERPSRLFQKSVDSEQASQANRSSTRVCVRICVSIRRPEFECSGSQLEGPEFECSGPQLEEPEFEYSELSLKIQQSGNIAANTSSRDEDVKRERNRLFDLLAVSINDSTDSSYEKLFLNCLLNIWIVASHNYHRRNERPLASLEITSGTGIPKLHSSVEKIQGKLQHMNSSEQKWLQCIQLELQIIRRLTDVDNRAVLPMNTFIRIIVTAADFYTHEQSQALVQKLMQHCGIIM
ncbi:hypothetical protein ANN_01361 [Periplaneta americana]|uniref:Uncharacterized protein n=1 Tax=Periplaneta americana TaxID=6978 RepID=A0ABQ8TTG1_PERAM|nr:hypothetical protein ANN_01361 [Periplaneta americana]